MFLVLRWKWCKNIASITQQHAYQFPSVTELTHKGIVHILQKIYYLRQGQGQVYFTLSELFIACRSNSISFSCFQSGAGRTNFEFICLYWHIVLHLSRVQLCIVLRMSEAYSSVHTFPCLSSSSLLQCSPWNQFLLETGCPRLEGWLGASHPVTTVVGVFTCRKGAALSMKYSVLLISAHSLEKPLHAGHLEGTLSTELKHRRAVKDSR